MKPLALLAAFFLATVAVAQDRITLTNGDVLTGSIKKMDEGTVTITSPLLGDLEIPMGDISDMTTQDMVTLQNARGDLLVQRRILGIEGGNLRLEGDNPLPLDNLRRINPPEKTPPKWEGSAKLHGMWTDGNTDRRTIGGSLAASRRTDADRFTVDAAFDYSEDKDNEPTSPTFREWSLNQRRVSGGLQYDYFLSQRLYALANARVLGDTLADIRLRFTGGVGLGYAWIEDGTTRFVTELGLSYVNENYRTPGTPGVDYMAARVAYKLSHAFTEKTKLVHGVEAFPSLEDADDIYLQAKTEIVTSLTDSMIASIAHVLDYDNTPSVTATRTFERVDNQVLLTVGWSF